MSRSAEIKEPVCKKFLKWSGKDGCFSYYDKEIEDEEERNVEVNLPLEFIVLDRCATVKGWSDEDESGIWSNEIRLKDLKTRPLVVRTKKGVVTEGLNAVIKDAYKAAGAKYHESVYILPYVNGILSEEIWNLQIGKSALTGGNKAGENDGTGWMAFTKKVGNPENMPNSVVCGEFKSKKNKAVAFNVPVFTKGRKLDNQESEIAKQVDFKLQDYLKYYFDRKPELVATTTEEVEEDDSSDYGD